MILIPLVAVLYAFAAGSFSVAAYYGFRLSRLTSKARVMIMITKDGPTSIVLGLLLAGLSQIPNILMTFMAVADPDVFVIPSAVLMVGSAIMFAAGFEKMYAVYLNERLKMRVNNVLDELLEKEVSRSPKSFQGENR